MNTTVSFETAKLLKERGFNKATLHFYTKPRSQMFGVDEHNRYYAIINTPKKLYTCGQHLASNAKHVYSAPTIADVVMWLYKEHGIWVHSMCDTNGNFYPKICFSKEENWFNLELRSEMNECNRRLAVMDFHLPEEAYEAAIHHTLKNLL